MTYDVTQADIDKGAAITNWGTVSGESATGLTATASDDATVSFTQSPAVTIEKTVDQATFSAPGTATYSYKITNTGNMTLTGLALNDDILGAITLTETTLAVGADMTATATYAVTQADIDAGADITNWGTEIGRASCRERV